MGTSLNGVKIPYIQYADDLCILGESAEDLQRGLDGLAAYCAENHLEINVSKTKIQIFHMGRLPQHEFQLNGQAVEIVSNFCYLGFNFSVQISFSQHAHNINSKARAKCGALLASLPLSNLPLPLILQLFDVFVLPTFTYGLPMWLSNCSASSLQAVDATFSKYLKRYLQVPLHSNNSIIHFLTSTVPLTTKLKHMAPETTGGLSFPPDLEGHRITFLSSLPAPCSPASMVQSIPTWFWLSRTFTSLPSNQNSRRALCREILDSNHYEFCKTTSFHPTPTLDCVCIFCGDNAQPYHIRFCTIN